MAENSSLILVTGGIKSGKSAYAQQLGEEVTGNRAFIATALALDEEMRERIRKHQADRRDKWETFEEPRDIGPLIERLSGIFGIILVDCLTMWISNLLTVHNLGPETIEKHAYELIKSLSARKSKIILVTNEVGMGIIPADSLSRSYQNLLGRLNRNIAAIADAVYLLVSGIPVAIKKQECS